MNCERNICYQQDYNGGCDTCPCNRTTKEAIENLKKLKSFHNGSYGSSIRIAIEALEKQAASEWIPVSERLPEEHDTMFAKFKGTDKWSDSMFAKKSDKVNVTVEFDDGSRMTQTLYTIDGEWKRETNIKHKVIAWRPLPEPYKGE